MKPFCTFLLITGFVATTRTQVQAQETEVYYLSGTGNDHTVPWDFFCTAGRNAGNWTTIAVPSNWELQGFGKYNYGFDKDTLRGKEKGLYKYRFTVPAAWKGKAVNIVFEGAMTDTEVKINGQPAGPVHQGSFYAFRYNISTLLNYGSENLLEATVAKHSANQSVNAAERGADFWIFGGIFRPVYLEALPYRHIARVAVDAKANGAFRANVYLGNAKGITGIEAELFTPDGKKAGAAFSRRINAGDSVVQLHTLLTSPRLWSSEFPNLYRVAFTLVQNGKPVHTVTRRFGFRTIVVKQQDGVYVNGTKIKFKGVCRHSFWPSSGRTLSRQLSLMDVQLMKDMNMNAVRMSHYPPDGHFLDVCDSLGLFVLDELAGWHGAYDTATGTGLLHEMMAHDENHPSIVCWINGNEGGHNYALDPVFESADIQHRPVIHAWEDFGGFDTQHYRDYNYGIGSFWHGHHIVMPTEFLHGMYDGGHGAGLEDYWEQMWHDPLSAGGFLWDFSDEGVVRTDRNGEIDTDGNHGADGIVGPYREKEGSFFTIKEVWAPIVFDRREITPAFDGTLRMENRFFYTNTRQCGFTAKLVKIADSSGSKVAAGKSFPVASPYIKPGEKGALTLDLPGNWQAYDFLYLTATDPFGRELFTWSWPVTRPAATAEKWVVKEGTGAVTVILTDSLYTVTAGEVSIAFHRGTGLLQQVRNAKGIIPFTNGPVLQEGVNNFAGFTHHLDGRNLVIASAFDKKSSYNQLQWTVYPSGWVKMEVRYFPGDYFTAFVGVNFSYPEAAVKSVQWMGNGPYRVWKNRMKGNRLGLWTKAYNNTATGEQPIVYPEFKGYHANMYWLTLLSDGQPVTIVTPDEDVFFRLFTPKFSNDPYNTAPLFPSGDISFMQGIAPIGTKTQKPETTGPMGMKHVFYDYEKEKARAKELTLFFNFSGK